MQREPSRYTEITVYRQALQMRMAKRDAELLISLRLMQSDRKAATEKDRNRNREV